MVEELEKWYVFIWDLVNKYNRSVQRLHAYTKTHWVRAKKILNKTYIFEDDLRKVISLIEKNSVQETPEISNESTARESSVLTQQTNNIDIEKIKKEITEEVSKKFDEERKKYEEDVKKLKETEDSLKKVNTNLQETANNYAIILNDTKNEKKELETKLEKIVEERDSLKIRLEKYKWNTKLIITVLIILILVIVWAWFAAFKFKLI